MIAALTAAAAVATFGPAQAPSVYVSPDGADGNRGTATAPVATFGRAYALAKPGSTIEVAAGDYGEQLVSRDRSKRSRERVVFRPAPGATVRLSLLDFGQDQFGLLGPEHVTVRNMAIDYIRAWAGSRDLVWQNIDAAHFDIFDAAQIVIRGGDYGPCQAPRDDLACVSRIAGRSSRITVDGATIHDITSTDPATYHVDGLFIRGGSEIVIRNSRFRRNMITNIRVQDQMCCKNSNLLLENNWFSPPLQGDGVSPRSDAINVDNGMSGLVIRNNSFVDSGPQLLGTYARTRIVGNLLHNIGCAAGARYSRNLFVPFNRYVGQRPCGATDRKVAGFGYENAKAFDLRLRPGASAFGAGDPDDCPARDIRGRPRLLGLKCDAGAYERQEAWVCHRERRGKRERSTSVLVALANVRARLREGDTIGRCGSR